MTRPPHERGARALPPCSPREGAARRACNFSSLLDRDCNPENEKGALPAGMCALRRRIFFLCLRRLVEIREVAAEEIARALLHLADALAREAPLLAEVLQRPRIVLRQAVAQDVPRQLAHALAHAAERIADVLVLLGAQELGIRAGAFVGEPIEVRRVAVAIRAQGLLERDVARRQAAVRHRPANGGRA